MTSAEIVPFVPGVQAIGIAVNWIGRGETIRTLEETIDQPRPKSNASLCTARRPHSANLACVHASAIRIAGEFVMRGPIVSARCSAVSITSLCVVPSSMIRAVCVRSTDCAASGVAANSAVVARSRTWRMAEPPV